MTPKAAFDNIISRVECLLTLYAELDTGVVFKASVGERATLNDDVLRAALVMAVAALDRYVHDRVTKRIIQAYKNRNLTHAQETFSIPVSIAITIAAKAEKAKDSKKQVRAANIVRNEVQQILHSRPFQSWRDIEFAFALIGKTGIPGLIQGQLKLATIKPLETSLAKINRTRNLIVHEGHLRRHKRGGKPSLLDIDAQTVRTAISTLKQLVDGLEAVV